MNPDPETEEAIFAEALRKEPGEECAQFLDQACGHDALLRQRVEDLLRADREAGHFMEKPSPPFLESASIPGLVFPEDASVAPRAAREGPGTRIGRYRLIEAIGEGGCGIVFLAEQDEPVRRRVALKLIKLGMDTRAVIARFDAERQALALMDHPGIAKVLDAGATEAGRPYFVMEFVQGAPIVQFCDEHQLTVPQRIRLFILVCQAIQHAHQKGIIHRDLKPSNILVTRQENQPVPKVIDFGIAKAIEGRLTERTLVTEAGQFIGTPAYMSPEQAERGHEDLDTRSDIYSLGVLLYELLTGRTPFDAREFLRDGWERTRQILREVDPPTPSLRWKSLPGETQATIARLHGTDAARMFGRIRGDLDWIVMKCLEKDRARRYETAAGLAADLRRHLQDEPVLAGPPRWSYRLRKGIRRYRLAVAMAASLTLLLLAGIGASTWQAVRATRAEIEQRRQTAFAELERKSADWQRHRAEEEREASRDLLYFATLNRVRQAWEEGNVTTASQLLEDVAADGKRGFEWYYWQDQLHRAAQTFRGHAAPVAGAAFLPDGRRIVSGSRDGKIVVWNAADGRILNSWTEPSGSLATLALSTQGDQVVTGGREGTITLWNPDSGALLGALKMEADEVDCLAISPGGDQLLSGSLGRPFSFWDLRAGREIGRFGEHLRRGQSATFSPDARRLVTTELAAISLWDATTLKRVERFQIGEIGDAMALSPIGKIALLAESTPRASIRDLSRFNAVSVVQFDGHHGLIQCVAFSGDGRQVLTGSQDGSARLWTVTGQPLRVFKGHRAGLSSVGFSPNARWVVTGSEDGTVKVWPAVVPQVQQLQYTGSRPTEWLRCAALMPDERRLVTGDAIGLARIWDLATGGELRTLEGHTDTISAVTVSKDGRQVLTGSADHTAKLWDADTGREIHTLGSRESPVTAVAFSPDGGWVAAAEQNGEVQIWESDSGRERFKLAGDGSAFTAAAFSPDGHWFVAGNAMGMVAVWEARSGAEVQRLRGENGIRTLAFSPDSRTLIAGQAGGSAIAWEVESWDRQFSMVGHLDEIRSLNFSRNGKRIVTASRDKTVRVWDAASGRELLIFGRGSTSGEFAAFSRDDRRILASDHSNLHVWESASATDVAKWNEEEAEGRPELGASPRGAPGAKTSAATPPDSLQARIQDLQLRAHISGRLTAWLDAADQLREVIKLNPADYTAWCRRGPLLLQVANVTGYREHCDGLLAQIQKTRDPGIVGQAVRSCLLMPSTGPEQTEKLSRLLDQAATAGAEPMALRYLDVARGLTEYRKAHFGDAEHWLLRSLEGLGNGGPDEDVATILLAAEAHAVLAMTQFRLGRREEAEATLAGRDIFFALRHQYDLGEHWPERLLVRILNREASELISRPVSLSPPPARDGVP